jgi:hypothetical protein
MTAIEDHEDLAARWLRFADQECRGYSPLYERISRAVAGDAELLALVQRAPPSSHQPNLLLAAVHSLLLAGLAHPLADVYGGSSSADPVPLFRDFCLTHREAVSVLLASRHTQTNECGRSAVIVPALSWVSERHGRALALVDVGASAGLNLLCDRYLLDYGPAGTTGPSDSPVRIDCRVVGGEPPIAARAPRFVERVGLDREPIDLDDADSARWLLACVWPDTGRMERTAAAIALARMVTPEVVRGDAVRDVTALLDGLPDDTVACVTTTWAFAYLGSEQRDAFIEQLALAGATRPIAWISAEAPGVVDFFSAGEPPGHDLMLPSVLGVVVFDGGAGKPTMLGWVHPHGRWIDWVA